MKILTLKGKCIKHGTMLESIKRGHFVQCAIGECIEFIDRSRNSNIVYRHSDGIEILQEPE